MYYQLPNGKTIWLDISDILNLSQEDIQYLISINSGEYVNSPFRYSALDDEDESSDNVDDSEEDTEDNPDYYYKQYFPDEFHEDPDEIDFDNLDN